MQIIFDDAPLCSRPDATVARMVSYLDALPDGTLRSKQRLSADLEIHHTTLDKKMRHADMEPRTILHRNRRCFGNVRTIAYLRGEVRE